MNRIPLLHTIIIVLLLTQCKQREESTQENRFLPGEDMETIVARDSSFYNDIGSVARRIDDRSEVGFGCSLVYLKNGDRLFFSNFDTLSPHTFKLQKQCSRYNKTLTEQGLSFTNFRHQAEDYWYAQFKYMKKYNIKSIVAEEQYTRVMYLSSNTNMESLMAVDTVFYENMQDERFKNETTLNVMLYSFRELSHVDTNVVDRFLNESNRYSMNDRIYYHYYPKSWNNSLGTYIKDCRCKTLYE